MKILSDHWPIIAFLNDAEADYALMGGHAVGLWAQKYVIGMKPLHSKDLDIRAEKLVAIALQSELKAKRYDWKDKQTGTPLIWAIGHGEEIYVEIFPKVPGLDESEQGYVIPLSISPYPEPINTIDPITLYLGKTETLLDRFQENQDGLRNDLKHLELLELCIPHYLESLKSRPSQPTPQTELDRLKASMSKRESRLVSMPEIEQKWRLFERYLDEGGRGEGGQPTTLDKANRERLAGESSR